MSDTKRKLNILIIPGIFPFPPDEGGKICIYGFIDSLRCIQNIHLFLNIYNDEQARIIEKMKTVWFDVTIHAIRENAPSGDVNFKNKFLKTAKKTGRETIKFLENSFKKNSFSYEDVDRTVSESLSPLFIKNLLKVLSETEFDIVQTEYTPFLNLVNVLPDAAKKIFVEIESLHSLVADYKNIPGIDETYVEYLSENIKTVELAYMSKYDAVFALSKSDEKNLKKLLPAQKIYTSAYPVLDNDVAAEMPEDFTVKKIVFMGGEQHPPNRDAVFWFAKDILPLLNLSDDVKVFVTGNWQAKTRKEISDVSDKIVFTGFVEDVKPLLGNSVSIAPIRLGGGGVRTKLIYAMAANSAVVTTSTAATGLMGKDADAFLTANTEREFADAINAILNDAKLAEQLVRNGKAIIEKHYSQKNLAARRNNFYYEIVNG